MLNEKEAMKGKVTSSAASKIKAAMGKENLNMGMLAAFTDTSPQCISDILHQKRPPSLITLCMIAKVLRLTLDELIPPSLYK